MWQQIVDSTTFAQGRANVREREVRQSARARVYFERFRFRARARAREGGEQAGRLRVPRGLSQLHNECSAARRQNSRLRNSSGREREREATKNQGSIARGWNWISLFSALPESGGRKADPRACSRARQRGPLFLRNIKSGDQNAITISLLPSRICYLVPFRTEKLGLQARAI